MNTIQVQIPQSYITACEEHGWSEQEAVDLFSDYLKEVINHPYEQTLQNFLEWTEDLVEED